MFELKNVTKRFDGQWVLHPTTLSITSGVTTVLIGPSGSGKSTLLRLLVGLTTPNSGVVHFAGKSITKSCLPEIRQRIGFMVQDGGLFPHLTARENVTLVARCLRWDRRRIEQRITNLAELTRFPVERLDRFPGQLSGGQRQRVSLMRAMMLDPQVLLLDEPLGALDPVIRFDLQNDLKSIFASLRKTVVLVTHDLAEASFFSDHLIMLHDGSILQQGTINDFIRNPADPFVQQFIRSQRLPSEFLNVE